MTYKRSIRPIHVCVLALVLSLALPASAEWNEKVLYSFQGGTTDGALPVGGVVFDKQGNLYGVLQFYGPGSCTPIGGECGAVFQLALPAKQGDPWTETLIYKFGGKESNDGESPNGGLIIDGQGNLYGVTAYGGTGNCVLLGVPAGCGTIYEVSPPGEKDGAWTETILYSFPTTKQGYVPTGNVVFDGVGNLYGATLYGGTKGTTCDGYYGGQCGTVFELRPPKTRGGKWTEKVLYSFKGVATGAQYGDGADPNGGLVLDNKGALYGTTYFGGNNVRGECEGGVGGTGCGIVFKLTPPNQKGGKWTKQLVHQFNGQDGANSEAGVVFDGSGNLYGTTFAGPPNGSGLIFELKKPSGNTRSWTETVLSLFNNETNGGSPISGLVFDSHGDLYGTASAGDEFRGGTVFALTPPRGKSDRWNLKVLHGFTGSPDAAHPAASLVFDKAGNLFGTSQWGGTGQSCQGGCGTVYEISP
jgi:hypothetical protein